MNLCRLESITVQFKTKMFFLGFLFKLLKITIIAVNYDYYYYYNFYYVPLLTN